MITTVNLQWREGSRRSLAYEVDIRIDMLTKEQEDFLKDYGATVQYHARRVQMTAIGHAVTGATLAECVAEYKKYLDARSCAEVELGEAFKVWATGTRGLALISDDEIKIVTSGDPFIDSDKVTVKIKCAVAGDRDVSVILPIGKLYNPSKR